MARGKSEERYVLVIRSLPGRKGRAEVPAVVRLKHVLKRLLRDYRFECVSVQRTENRVATDYTDCTEKCGKFATDFHGEDTDRKKNVVGSRVDSGLG